MIDPITAMAAVSSAVSLIKKASSTVDDIRSLGPLLGKYFDAKAVASKAVVHAKRKGGSNMGVAIQVELELMQQRQFEEDLKMLFFQSGHADVWDSIQARVAQMNRDDAIEARKLKEAEARKRKQFWETVEAAIGVVIIITIFAALGIMAYLGFRK